MSDRKRDPSDLPSGQIDRLVWRTRSQLELAVVEYISWFNHDRLHESLGDIPPVEFEQHHTQPVAVDPEPPLLSQPARHPDTRATPPGSLPLYGVRTS